MAAGAGGVDNGEGVSAGVGGEDELELLELLLWRWRRRHACTGGGVNSVRGGCWAASGGGGS